ncbi:MAG: hypothetical protein A2008_05670 [Candidatus Wallbacteria bacterium GWC2_49_35]|uniref:PEP-utilising enzyme mobile domain-containing protein n=1 Tax=Candidatus Wallbacteria bacterium GWC2_49_35 TaxID=1817813 RepID=A0A1F7WUS9_9BACT|nr:MAG: hypothetical protein A2008_05670 [Candidatus Wallbacteria bacterium GWC2_49_35]
MRKNVTGGTIVWSKSNAGELFPFVATPMTFSVSKKFITSLLSPFTKNFGINIAGSLPFGLVAGRIYVNMNFAAALVRKATFSLKSDFSELFGGDCGELARALEILKHANGSGVDFSWIKFISRLPYMAFHFAAKNFSAKRFEIDGELIETLEKYYAADFKKYPAPDLLPVIDRLSLLLEKTTEKAWPAVLGAMIANAWVFAISGSERANVLLAGSGGMASAESGTSLLKLALSAKNSGLSETLASFEEFTAAARALETKDNGRAFLYNFEKFMRVHGHHAPGEVDAACPRWRETPDRIFSIVKSYLARGGIKETLDSLERLRAQNKAQARKIISGSKLGPLKGLFRAFISTASNGLVFRENYKNRLVMMIDIIRKVLLEAASRLLAAEVITERNDIFFMDLAELQVLLDGGGGHVKDNISRQINIRKTEYSNCEKVDPPSVVIGDFDIAAALEKIENGLSKEKSGIRLAAGPVDTASEGSVFKGIAVSGGIVTGPARVVKSAEAAETVGHGEILVAPFTDPGWTPYFVNAAGLVTALGGPLSHGSIIAREYGIPAVVNVKNITTLISTGQMIRVDGYKGTVTVL